MTCRMRECAHVPCLGVRLERAKVGWRWGTVFAAWNGWGEATRSVDVLELIGLAAIRSDPGVRVCAVARPCRGLLSHG